MKTKIFFRKQHKWIGIVVCLSILLFCISGIILNHRKAFGNVNVPRRVPSAAYAIVGSWEKVGSTLGTDRRGVSSPS